MLGDEDRRRGGTELASGVEGGVRRAPGRLRSTRGAPAVRPGAQGGPELNGGEQLLKSESSPAWRSAAERDGGGARVYGGDCEARWGVGGPRGLLIGRRLPWRARPGLEPRRDLRPGISAGRCASEGDGSDRGARAVSGWRARAGADALGPGGRERARLRRAG